MELLFFPEDVGSLSIRNTGKFVRLHSVTYNKLLISPPAGLGPQIVQPVASPHTDYAIAAANTTTIIATIATTNNNNNNNNNNNAIQFNEYLLT
jgi:hypothetical protein